MTIRVNVIARVNNIGLQQDLGVVKRKSTILCPSPRSIDCLSERKQ